jgi:hypothetical protein
LKELYVVVYGHIVFLYQFKLHPLNLHFFVND